MNFKASPATASAGADCLLRARTARQVNQLLRVMRITTILLLAGCLQTAARTHSQTVTLSGKNISLETVFSEIKKQTRFDVLYTYNMVSRAAPITVNAKNIPLKDFLEMVLKEQSLTYSIQNTTIAIKKKASLSNHSPSPFLEDRPISGVVIDEEGNAVMGATVTLRRTKRSVVTDAEGRFTLNIREGDILIISFVGYEAHETRVTSAMTAFGDIQITLLKSVSKLDEVQILGYGTTTRRLSTGTISSVKAEVIEKQPIANVIGTMDGRMAGVEVIQPNGLPGAGFAVRVRGDNTLGVNFGFSSSDPLYVIDGIPQITGYRSFDTRLTVGVYGMNGGTNLLSNINPKDILQIDVLKDADATAIYGARGANGVVLITTKKGQAGKIKLNVDLNAGYGKVPRFIPVLNTQEYLELRKEAFANEGITPDANNAPDLVTWDQDLDNDFQRILLSGSAKQSSANINLSGGTENIKYYAGLNYRRDGTVFNPDQFVRRIGGLFNLDVTSLNRKFNAQFALNYSNEQTDISATDFPSLFFAPPNYNPVNADGTYNWDLNFSNPFAALLTKYNAVNTLLNASMTLSYRPINGLVLKLLSSYTNSRSDNNTQSPAASSNPFYGPPSGSATFAFSPNSSYTIEPQATYSFSINNSEFTALAGGTLSSTLSESNVLYGYNYSYESQLNNIAAAGQISTSYLYNKYNYASGFARLSYDLNHKYLINLNYRKDASSRFGPNNKQAAFASVGAAWIFTAENGIKEAIPFMTFGKLKASYGSAGNDRVDNYLYELYYSKYLVTYLSQVYQGITALGAGAAGNPLLAWETTRKAELSLDLGFLRDRIILRANMYRNRSSNIINASILPAQSGTGFITSNVDAIVQNKGFEFELTARNVLQQNFSWNTSFNITFQRNKLLRFNDIQNTFAFGRYIVGEPVDAYLNYYFYQYSGPDPITGIPTYADLDGNPGADKYVARLGTPFYGGLTNTITYKNFMLDVFLKFENRMGKLNDVMARGPLGSMHNQNRSALNRYQPGKENIDPVWPAAVSGTGPLSSSYDNFYSSDFRYGNAAYLKLKNVSLSYDIPNKWLGGSGIQNLKLYVQGQNLFVLAKQKYVMDPEMGSAYPGLRTFVFGINCSL